MAEYSEGRWRGFILVPEGRGGRGWRSFTSELRLVLQFFQLLYSDGSARVHTGVRSSLGLGKCESMRLLESPVEVVGNRLYVEVLTRSRKFLASSSSMRGISGNSTMSAPKG